MTFAELKTRVYFLTGTDVNSYSNANLTLAIGRALERVVSLINRSDSRWQWDDSNYSDLPSATLTITSGQQQYSLATTHLSIDRIEVKDSSGSWRKLAPIDQTLITRDREQALALGEGTPSTGRTGAYKSGTGIPSEYDVRGINFFLFPTPDFTQSASIHIYFTRVPLLFDYVTGQFTDSTGSTASSPGFNSLFHDLIALWASYDYAFAFGKQNANAIFAEIVRKEDELQKFYGQRNRDERPRITISQDSNK
jgi:hypothetical protein